MDTIRFACLAAAVLTLSSIASAASPTVVPAVKAFTAGTGEVSLKAVSIAPVMAGINGEIEHLRTSLAERQVDVKEDGVPLRMVLGKVDIPEFSSAYRREIERQAYRLTIQVEGITIQSATRAGIHYGIQTLRQMITDEQTVPAGIVLDWPDFARRMIMVDMARANENMDYYRRVVEFCDRYKINYLHLHLTDDENAALYHQSYPWLMSPHPWREADLQELVAFADRHHITLIPEVESLGHARLFVRHPDFKEILHQTTDKTPKANWAGTQVPGYTNVLCPASEKTYEYLGGMYTAASVFPAPELHIGLDEVDQTECARCQEKWPGISHVEWFIKHLQRCQALVDQGGRKMSLWGDMILHHRDIADALPVDRTLIYDWHYNPDMTDESVEFFKSKGFEIIACPALMCHPHMILPSDFNYVNIQRFAEIARKHDLRGFDITVWTPTRYMSDAIWPGFAYATAHAWSGSKWDEAEFYRSFVRDFFGSPQGEEFGRVWKDLYNIKWRLDRFNTSCWMDEATLAEAQAKAGAWADEARAYRARLEPIREALAAMRSGVRQNMEAWDAMVQSTSVYAYVFDHFLAAPDVRRDGQWDRARLAELDKGCVEALTWIEANWDRNRFADDPDKDGRNMPNQNLLYRFRQMHRFHEQMLKAEK
jgi:hypothetical protein